MQCTDCKDGFYYPFTGERQPCATCGGTRQISSISVNVDEPNSKLAAMIVGGSVADRPNPYSPANWQPEEPRVFDSNMLPSPGFEIIDETSVFKITRHRDIPGTVIMTDGRTGTVYLDSENHEHILFEGEVWNHERRMPQSEVDFENSLGAGGVWCRVFKRPDGTHTNKVIRDVHLALEAGTLADDIGYHISLLPCSKQAAALEKGICGQYPPMTIVNLAKKLGKSSQWAKFQQKYMNFQTQWKNAEAGMSYFGNNLKIINDGKGLRAGQIATVTLDDGTSQREAEVEIRRGPYMTDAGAVCCDIKHCEAPYAELTMTCASLTPTEKRGPNYQYLKNRNFMELYGGKGLGKARDDKADAADYAQLYGKLLRSDEVGYLRTPQVHDLSIQAADPGTRAAIQQSPLLNEIIALMGEVLNLPSAEDNASLRVKQKLIGMKRRLVRLDAALMGQVHHVDRLASTAAYQQENRVTRVRGQSVNTVIVDEICPDDVHIHEVLKSKQRMAAELHAELSKTITVREPQLPKELQ